VKRILKGEVGLRPLLIPYTKESEQWLPSKFPAFQMETDEKIGSADWRFILSLRKDGSVMECFSLSGGDENGLEVMIAWLKSLRFQEAVEQERWMGLRIEFINQRNHGTDPE
jgi:hypothetical protein